MKAKHKWVTEAINAKENSLSVWPSQEELQSKTKLKKFFETIEKIGNDPRVIDIRRDEHREHKVVFIFTIDTDVEA
jgi:hypothetical protein